MHLRVAGDALPTPAVARGQAGGSHTVQLNCAAFFSRISDMPVFSPVSLAERASTKRNDEWTCST